MKFVSGTDKNITIEMSVDDYTMILNVMAAVRQNYEGVDREIVDASYDQVCDIDSRSSKVFYDYFKEVQGWDAEAEFEVFREKRDIEQK